MLVAGVPTLGSQPLLSLPPAYLSFLLLLRGLAAREAANGFLSVHILLESYLSRVLSFSTLP
jgi:hypothetical protein